MPGSGVSSVLAIVAPDGLVTQLPVLPAARAIVSWNARHPVDTIEVRVDTIAGHRSRPLPYVAFEAGRRASLDGFDNVARIATDVITATNDIAGLEVRSHARLDFVAASTPPAESARAA